MILLSKMQNNGVYNRKNTNSTLRKLCFFIGLVKPGWGWCAWERGSRRAADVFPPGSGVVLVLSLCLLCPGEGTNLVWFVLLMFWRRPQKVGKATACADIWERGPVPCCRSAGLHLPGPTASPRVISQHSKKRATFNPVRSRVWGMFVFLLQNSKSVF